MEQRLQLFHGVASSDTGLDLAALTGGLKLCYVYKDTLAFSLHRIHSGFSLLAPPDFPKRGSYKTGSPAVQTGYLKTFGFAAGPLPASIVGFRRCRVSSL